MEQREFILSILQIATACISPLIAFVLGRWSTSAGHKRNHLKKRLDKFYLPYLRVYLAGLSWSIPFSEKPLESRSRYFDLIMENFQYTSSTIQALIPRFYFAWLEFLEWEDGNTDREYPVDPVFFVDSMFFRITETVFEEYKKLCRQLKLPVPAMPPLPPGAQHKTEPESEA